MCLLFAVQALSNDAAFVRVRKGVYALRALAGNVGPVPHNTPKSSRPPLGRGWDHRDSYRSVSSSHVCHHCPVANTVLRPTCQREHSAAISSVQSGADLVDQLCLLQSHSHV